MADLCDMLQVSTASLRAPQLACASLVWPGPCSIRLAGDHGLHGQLCDRLQVSRRLLTPLSGRPLYEDAIGVLHAADEHQGTDAPRNMQREGNRVHVMVCHSGQGWVEM